MKAQNRITLTPLTDEDRNQFVLDNQYAFKYGACEELGLRDNYFDDDGEIISCETIEKSIADGVAYRIRLDGKIVGGLVLRINEKTQHNHLELLFVSPDVHSKGIGFAAWQEVESLYPNTKVWETCTPYFEKRNVHFYINKCGFHAVEFFGEFNRDPNEEDCGEGPSEMLRFEKKMS